MIWIGLFIILVIGLIYWLYYCPYMCPKCNTKNLYIDRYDADYDKNIYECKKCGNTLI